MTDFSHVTYARCPICKTRFILEEGPLCDCCKIWDAGNEDDIENEVEEEKEEE